MDDDKPGSERRQNIEMEDGEPFKRSGNSVSVGVLFQSNGIQRGVCIYNEAHRLLLGYFVNFLRCCWNIIRNLCSNEDAQQKEVKKA